MLTACQYKQAISAPLVRDHLKVRQERGYALDFINDSAFVELGQKPLGIGLREISLIRCFQVGVFQVRKGS